MAEQAPVDYSHWLDQELRRPTFVQSLGGYVVLYEVLKIGQGAITLRDSLQSARDFAKDLEGVVEGVGAKSAETMTLAQYAQLVRELRIASLAPKGYQLHTLLGSRLVLLDTHLELKHESGGKIMADIYERGTLKKPKTLIQDASGFVIEHEPETYVPLRTSRSDVSEFWFYFENLEKSERSKARAVMGLRHDRRDYIHASYPLDAKVTIGSPPDKYIEKIVIPIILYRRKKLLRHFEEVVRRITNREQLDQLFRQALLRE